MGDSENKDKSSKNNVISFPIQRPSPDDEWFYRDMLNGVLKNSYVLDENYEKEAIENITIKTDVFDEFREFDQPLKLKSQELSKLKHQLNELKLPEKNPFPIGTGGKYLFNGTGCFLYISYFLIMLSSLNEYAMVITPTVLLGISLYFPIKRFLKARKYKRDLNIAAKLQKSIEDVDSQISKLISQKKEKAKELFEKRKNTISHNKILRHALSLQINFLSFVSVNDWVRTNKYFHQKKIDRGFRKFGCVTEFEKNGNVIVKSPSGSKSLFTYDADLTQPKITRLKEFYLSFLNSGCDSLFYISNKEFSAKSKDFARENSINLLTTEQFIFMVVDSIKDPLIFPMSIYLTSGSKKYLESWIGELISMHKKNYELVKEFMFKYKAPEYDIYFKDRMAFIDFGLSCVFDQQPITESILDGVEESTIEAFLKLISNQ